MDLNLGFGCVNSKYSGLNPGFGGASLDLVVLIQDLAQWHSQASTGTDTGHPQGQP